MALNSQYQKRLDVSEWITNGSLNEDYIAIIIINHKYKNIKRYPIARAAVRNKVCQIPYAELQSDYYLELQYSTSQFISATWHI